MVGGQFECAVESLLRRQRRELSQVGVGRGSVGRDDAEGSFHA